MTFLHGARKVSIVKKILITDDMKETEVPAAILIEKDNDWIDIYWIESVGACTLDSLGTFLHMKNLDGKNVRVIVERSKKKRDKLSKEARRVDL